MSIIGNLYLLSGPSGSGKSTLIQRASEHYPLEHSISATTRQPRQGEQDGTHYHFLNPEQFQQHIQNNQFLEHATVHSNQYGTLKSEVIPVLEQGKNVIMDIDIQGARQIRRQATNHPTLRRALIDIFITTRSQAELKQRLTQRATDDPQTIQRRLQNALTECAAWHEYSYLIPSQSRDQDWQKLQTILQSSQLKASHQSLDFS